MIMILTICSMILVSGCLNPDTINIKKPKIDSSIQSVDRQNIKSMSNMSSIALEWSIVNDPEIKGYNIYRSDTNKTNRNFVLLKSLENRFISHFVDTGLQPNTSYFYSISTISKNNRESKSSLPYEATTKKTISSVSYIVALSQLPGQTKIMWRPHTNQSIYFYLIERSHLKVDKWLEIARVKGRLNSEYIDQNVQHDKTYRYRIFCVTYDGIKSSPSQEVLSKTKQPPKSPKNIKASSTQSKQITISWQPSNDIKSIKYYQIYKGVGSTNYMFSPIAKVDKKLNSYIHKIGKADIAGFYKVTVIDKDNLESSKNIRAIVGKTRSRPAAPIVINVQKGSNFISFVWKSPDNKATYYYVRKTKGSLGFFSKIQKIGKIRATSFKDQDVQKGEKYTYTVQAVDKYGTMSQKSLETTIQF